MMRTLRTLKYFFLILGLSLLGGGIYDVVTKRSFIAASVATTGTIVRVEWHRSHIGTSSYETHRPVVQFVAVDGKTVQFHGNDTSRNWRYRVGERLRVWYDPRKPTTAMHGGFVALWLTPLIAILIGAVVMLAWTLINLSEFLMDVWLRLTGVRVQTHFVQARQNPLSHFNGVHPYNVISRGPDPRTGRHYEFTSADLWVDLSLYAYPEPITVYMKRDDPTLHYMDLSFLKARDLPPLEEPSLLVTEHPGEGAMAQRAAVERAVRELKKE